MKQENVRVPVLAAVEVVAPVSVNGSISWLDQKEAIKVETIFGTKVSLLGKTANGEDLMVLVVKKDGAEYVCHVLAQDIMKPELQEGTVQAKFAEGISFATQTMKEMQLEAARAGLTAGLTPVETTQQE